MDDFRLLLLAIIVMTGTWAFIAYQSNECSVRGGDFVRGVVWFKCVGEK